MRLVGSRGEVSQKRQKLPFARDFHDISSHDFAKHLVGVYALKNLILFVGFQ